MENKKIFDESGNSLAIERPEVLQEAIETWGMLAQTDMAIEEMSELTKAILKYRRAYGKAEGEAAKENIREEIADVFIMLTQLLMIFGGREDVQRTIDEKVNRLARRLKSERTGMFNAAMDAAEEVLQPAT